MIMKKLLFLFLVALTGRLAAQTSCTGFTRNAGDVIGNQTVVLMPINSPGFCYIQGLVYYPKGYFLAANANKKYGLLVTLNGAGQGQSQDIAELNSDFIPQLIAGGLDPYGIDQVTGDTVRFLVVSPHAASSGGAYSYPQLKYTIPWMLSNLRVDTTCVWVAGLSQGCRGTVSCVMGDALGDTALGKLLTGIIPLSGAGYDARLTDGSGANRNLDTLLKRGLYVKYAIGSQDQNYNAVGFFPYDSVYRRFCLPGRYVDSVFPGIGHAATVWSSMWPLASRIFDPKTMNIWSQMWAQRRISVPTTLSVYAGADQTFALPQDSVLLSGVGTPAPGTSIAAYAWSRVSGPNTPTIVNPSSATTIVRGLIAGTYQFRLQVTSSASTTAADTIQVLVQAAPVFGPSVSVGPSQNILQPASSATLTGNAMAGSSAISTHTWTFISGPVTPTIVTPLNYTTSVTGMSSLGQYAFKLKAVDANGLADSGTVQITVQTTPLAAKYVTKPSMSEYLCAHMYSDSTVRTFIYNNVSGKVEFTPYIIGGLKAIDVAPLFNRMAVMDQNHYTWTSNSGTPTCTRIDLDTTGAAFNYCDRIYGYFYGLFFIRTDSTEIWNGGTGVNGDTYNFYKRPSNNIGNKPIKFNAPTGKKWVKLALGKDVLGLTSTGEVWKWSAGDTNYVRITGFTGPAVDIAASQNDFYGILVHDYTGGDPTMGNPYWFGSQPGFVGDVASRTTPFAVRSLWGLTQSCRQIFFNNNTAHVIDSSRNMWGIGDNPQGEVGNGQELVNHVERYGTPYSWTWTKYELLVPAPMVQIGAGIPWKRGFSGNAFAFYLMALDMNDSLYNWGRDKSFIGGKGLVNNNEVSTPNSLDVLSPTMITPLRNTPAVGFNFQLPTCQLGPDQSINTSTTTLTGTATAAKSGAYGFTPAFYVFKKLTGPAATITTPTTITTGGSVSTTVTGLVTGVYTFQLLMTDNNTGTVADTIQVTVGGTVFTPPTVTNSGNQTILLPANSATIAATVTPHGATINSATWSKLSGPVAGTITTPGSLTTTVTGLVAGVYVFRMTAIDSNAQSTTSDLTITVSTPSNLCNCLSSPVPITFPKN